MPASPSKETHDSCGAARGKHEPSGGVLVLPCVLPSAWLGWHDAGGLINGHSVLQVLGMASALRRGLQLQGRLAVRRLQQSGLALAHQVGRGPAPVRDTLLHPS